LEDINFEVQEGEWLGIVGRNGCGKSTLLKIISGIYSPDRGSIAISRKFIPFLELGVGFNFELSARENIFLNGLMLQMTKKEIEGKFKDIIDFAEVNNFVDTKLKYFSSGMQVRLGFSIAMHASTDIYLLDEVLAVGDMNFQKKSYDVFKNLKRLKKTVLFVSHNLESVIEFCDRAIFLENGKIKAIGRPRNVIACYQDVNMAQEEEKLGKQQSTDLIKLREQQKLLEQEVGKNGAQANDEANAVEEKDAEKLLYNQRAEWGDKRAIVSNTTFEDPTGKSKLYFRQGDDIQIKIEYAFYSTINDPIFGIVINNSEDKPIFASNTMWLGMKTGMISKGEKRTVTFVLPRVPFPEDKYFVSPAIASDNGRTFHDWKANWFSFSIKGKQNYGKYFDLQHKVIM
jgi:ABC-type polysaccharide/polyol phosphate transport system ATPase subunit